MVVVVAAAFTELFLCIIQSLKKAPFDHLCSSVEELRMLLPTVATVA